MPVNLLKYLGYVTAAFISLTLFLVANVFIGTSVSDWLINISAAFFFIPCAFLGFELINSSANQELNKEMFEYVKKDIDNELMTTIRDFLKFLNYSTGTTRNLDYFLEMSLSDIETRLSQISPLGFEVLKKWSTLEEHFNKVLNNPIAQKVFSNEQIIAIIQLIKGMILWESHIQDKEIWQALDKDSGFKVVSGEELSDQNVSFPGRLVLLEKTKKHDTSIVRDFGDFKRYNEENLLRRFRLKEEAKKRVALEIRGAQSLIKKWIELTGGEFVFDARRYRSSIKPL